MDKKGGVQSKVDCRRALELCRFGDYPGAAVMLSFARDCVAVEPSLTALGEEDRACALLVVGWLTSYFGKSQRIGGAQERAKNLLSRAVREFDSLGDGLHACEAQIVLASCYLHQNDHDEARIMLYEALGTEVCQADDHLRMRAYLWLIMAECEAGRFKDALEVYEQLLPLVSQGGDLTREGKCFGEYGSLLTMAAADDNAAEFYARAEEAFDRAAWCFERSGDNRLLARIENNRVNLMLRLKRYDEALVVLDRAHHFLAASGGDESMHAQMNETRAQLLLALGRNDEAETLAASAVSALEVSDEYGVLVEALITLGTALARQVKIAEATSAFARAQGVAESRMDSATSSRAAMKMIEVLSPEIFAGAGLKFDPAVRLIEAGMIKRALQLATGGSVTEAAFILGLQYQSLDHFLCSRHQTLIPLRSPKKKRLRSVIAKEPGKVLRYSKKG